MLDEQHLDPALAAEMLSVADPASLADGLADIDPEAVHQSRARIETALAGALEPRLLARYHARDDDGDAVDTAAQARRRLRNTCLAALCRADVRHRVLARAHYERARNLTDRLAALGVLLSVREGGVEATLGAFAQQHDDATIPPAFDFDAVRGLSAEALGKLKQVRPQTIGEARRISGITPAAVSLLLVHLRRAKRVA